MVTEDAGDSVVAARQGERVVEALGAKAGQATEFDDLAFEAWGSLVGAVLGATTVLLEGGRLSGNRPAQPLPHGVARTAELPRGGLAPVGAGKGHQLLMQPMTISAHAIEFKVSAVHHPRMASFPRRCSCSSGGAGAAHPYDEHSTL